MTGVLKALDRWRHLAAGMEEREKDSETVLESLPASGEAFQLYERLSGASFLMKFIACATTLLLCHASSSRKHLTLHSMWREKCTHHFPPSPPLPPELY